jgi:3-oxoacyl-[acyl-carrier-protein] synthase II
MNIKLNGIGMIGAFGTGYGELRAAVENGHDYSEKITVKGINGNVEFPYFKADTQEIINFFPARKLRRIDHFSKMSLLAACLSIKDAGFELSEIKDKKTGLILATGHGAMNSTYAFKDSINNKGDLLASPISFSKSIHSTAMANLTSQLGIKGPNLTVSQHACSFQSALLSASVWIDEGICDFVIVGGVDEFSETLGYCIERFKNEENTASESTYNIDLTPGEGAAFVILSNFKNLSGNEKDKYYGNISDIKTGNIRHADVALDENTCLILDSNSRQIISWIKKNNIKNKIITLEKPYGHFFTSTCLDLISALPELKEFPSIALLNIEEDGQFYLIRINT